MRITAPFVEAYLKCPVKCFLCSAGETGTVASYDRWVRTENESYREAQASRMVGELAPDAWVIGLQE
jgi:hypothetical protein